MEFKRHAVFFLLGCIVEVERAICSTMKRGVEYDVADSVGVLLNAYNMFNEIGRPA